MDRAEFTLSRPVCLSLPVEEVDKLLREKDGRCALTYLALLRAGGKPFPAESIGLTERETAERDALRKEYLADMRAAFKQQLDSTYVQTADGAKIPYAEYAKLSKH